MARELALQLSTQIIKISRELGANLNTVESTIRKLKSEKEMYFENLKFLIRERLLGLIPKTLRTKHQVALITGNFTCLLNGDISAYVSQKINCNNAIVIIANKSRSAANHQARIVFARSNSIPIDSGEPLREALPQLEGQELPDFMFAV